MPYQRPLFATFALLYCLCLGLISLYSNPKSKLHRLFAFYNFSLGLYNSADYALFMTNQTWALWFVRLVSPAGAFMTYYFLCFTYEASGFSQTEKGKKIILVARNLAIIFGLLYLTPLMLKDVNILHKFNPGLEIPGPLYMVFGVFNILGLIYAVAPLWRVRKIVSEIQRKQISYIFAACVTGILALASYILSVFWIDLPWMYYSMEALVGFILIYAIFQYNLISITVALRRLLLVAGIYLGLSMIVVPAAYYAYHTLVSFGPGQMVLLILLCGVILSLGPIIYAHVLRHFSVFHDTSVSQIAHELKSPLSSIQSAKAILEDELMEKEPNPEKMRSYLDMIQRNSDRLEKYVMEILNYQKSAGFLVPEKKEPLNLAEIVGDCVRLRLDVSQRVQVQIDGDMTMRGYRDGLHQIFSNLISNSLNHAPTGMIRIELERKGEKISGSVIDSGRGIPTEHLDQIFKPFSKSNTFSSKSSGLGLSIVFKWVQTHGGHIWAESPLEPGSPTPGTAFRFILPVE